MAVIVVSSSYLFESRMPQYPELTLKQTIVAIKAKITINFFKTIQNKMHYAVSNNTAAEIVYNRIDSKKENIGLTKTEKDYLRLMEINLKKIDENI